MKYNIISNVVRRVAGGWIHRYRRTKFFHYHLTRIVGEEDQGRLIGDVKRELTRHNVSYTDVRLQKRDGHHNLIVEV